MACEQVAGDTRGGTFEFVMPERDVTLGVIIQEFKPEEYPINAPVSQEYTVAVAKTAVAGEVVDVEIVVTNGMFAVSACLFNDSSLRTGLQRDRHLEIPFHDAGRGGDAHGGDRSGKTPHLAETG